MLHPLSCYHPTPWSHNTSWLFLESPDPLWTFPLGGPIPRGKVRSFLQILIPASPAHSPDKNTPMIQTLCGSVLVSLTRPPNLHNPTMILILCVVALVISLPLPPPMDSQEKEQPYTFRGLDCFSQRHTEVKSFFAAEPADCQNADIFMEPSLKPAQIISVSNFHPIEAVWCSVKIKAFTASCGESSSINMRNHFMFNKQIFDDEFSPPPQQCYEANKTNTEHTHLGRARVRILHWPVHYYPPTTW